MRRDESRENNVSFEFSLVAQPGRTMSWRGCSPISRAMTYVSALSEAESLNIKSMSVFILISVVRWENFFREYNLIATFAMLSYTGNNIG